ncbi:FtsX-like permease family protein, partial [Couchioplanes caeruleus]
VEAVVAGTLLAFVGFVLLSPAVVPAVVRLLGVPAARLGGTTVSLALRNAVRNPRRIAATTNALVIGVTLVSTFTLMNESAKAPAEGKADARFGAHFLVTDGGTLSVLPPALVDSLRRMPELGTLYPQWEAFDGGEDDFLAVHAGYPVILSRGYPEHDGSIAALTPGTAVVTRETGIPVGQKVTVRGRAFTVVAAVPDTEDSAVLERSVWLTPDDLTKLFPKPSLSQLQADPASGVPASAARAALDRAARDFPTMTVHDRAAYVAELNAPLEQMLAVVTGLLVLAVVVALIGVANTLTLSVLERTRENTLLRAVGLTRRQLRGTLAAEALVMALTGTVLGVVASLVITRTLLSAIGRRGADLPLVVPWDRLGVLLAVAVVAALAASVLPARRAARRPVAENLAGE